MKKKNKIFLGLATVLPIFYICFFFIFIFCNLIFPLQIGVMLEDSPPVWLLSILILHLIMILWMIGLLIIYINNVYKNKNIQEDKKLIIELSEA